VAFVATVYGVGAANLFFLPLGNKIKLKLKREAAARTVIIAGLVGVAQGDNPRILQEKLEVYLPHAQRSKPESH
jgi:chemotaxis protein MotA